MEDQNSSNTDKNPAKNALAVIGLLFILPPLLFWLTVALKFGGATDFFFRFWDYLPEFMLDGIIIILPIPSLLLGAFALWQIKKQKAKGVTLSIATISLSTLFIVLCVLAALRPN